MKQFNIKRKMMKIISLAVIMGIVISSTTYAEVPSDWKDKDVVPGKIIIKYKESKASKVRSSLSSGVPGLSIKMIEAPSKERFLKENPSKQFKNIFPKMFISEFNPDDLESIYNSLLDDPDIEFFEPARYLYSVPSWGTDEPDDPKLQTGEMWNMPRIGAPEVWAKMSSTRSTIRVAVCEDNFQQTHIDLSSQVSSVQNPSSNTSDHATHVAGIIAATGNNSEHVVGVANVELVSLSSGNTDDEFIDNISWAVNHGVDVINMSFGWIEGTDTSDFANYNNAIQNAIEDAQNDIVFVGSMGNNGVEFDADGDPHYPSAYDGVLGVTNLTKTDNLSGSSNFGYYADITAPGDLIRSTITGNTTARMSGTSMASPHVAGVAAAVLMFKPSFSKRDIPMLLELSAEDIGPSGRDDSFGWGVVRVDRAVAGIADVYAYKNGFSSDSNSGRLRSPKSTLQGALNEITAGETIGLVYDPGYYGTDDYDETITIRKECRIMAVGGTIRVH